MTYEAYFLRRSPCAIGVSVVYCNMINRIRLNKKEQEFIAENITRFDVVTEIEINDIEVRIHGEHFGGVGSAAIYRTNDMKMIWNHTTNKIKKIEKNLKKVLDKS